MVQQSKTTKWSHRMDRRPSSAGIITGVSEDVSYFSLRPQGAVRFTGQFLTTDPTLSQYPSGPDTGLAAPFETLMGRNLDCILVFGDANNIASNTFRFADWPGRREIISLNLTAPLWDQQATGNGAHDDVYIASAAALKPFESWIVSLRIGWEMNITGYPWAPGGTNTNISPANYVKCFQRYANYLREAMPSVLIDWCPNMGADPTAYYPGDQYVDVISVDAYQNSAFFPDSWGAIYENPFSLQWLDGFSSVHGKFMGLGEWATNYNSGNYITDMARWLKRPRANPVIYHSYWNSNDAFPGLLTDRPACLAAYLAAFGDPGNIYVGAP